MSSAEWLALQGVAEYAKEFSQAEFTLAAIAQKCYPNKWPQHAALFARLNAGAGSSKGSASLHVGLKSAAQLEGLQKKLQASSRSRVTLRIATDAAAAKPIKAGKPVVACCPSCSELLAGHVQSRCAQIQSISSKVLRIFR